MFFGRIALVVFPVITIECLAKFRHDLISMCFCENRCGSYGLVNGIALYDTSVFYFSVRIESVSVDDEVCYLVFFQLINSSMHG